MATNCSVDVDCLEGAPRDWCTVARTCDAQYSACTVWPRCVSPPWLGCLAEAQRCVSLNVLAAYAPTQPSALAALNDGLLALVIIVIVSGTLSIIMMCAYLPRSRTHR